MSLVFLSKPDLGNLLKLLRVDHGHGEVCLIQPMRADERVCSVSDKVKFDKQANFSMYEVVMNAIGVDIPFLMFEVNVLRFLNAIGLGFGFCNIRRSTQTFGCHFDCSPHFFELSDLLLVNRASKAGSDLFRRRGFLLPLGILLRFFRANTSIWLRPTCVHVGTFVVKI